MLREFDDCFMRYYKIGEMHYDNICEYATDDELDILVRVFDGNSDFSKRRKAIEVINKYKNMIGIIVIGLVVFLILSEISSFAIYGNLIEKEIQDKFIIRLDTLDYELHGGIINTYFSDYTQNFITTTVMSVFAKYYIFGIGMVPRWSELHKKINDKYKELKLKQM